MTIFILWSPTWLAQNHGRFDDLAIDSRGAVCGLHMYVDLNTLANTKQLLKKHNSTFCWKIPVFGIKTNKSKSFVAIDVRVQLNQMSTIYLKDVTYASRDDDWVCSSTHTRLPRKIFTNASEKSNFVPIYRMWVYI